MNPKAQQFDTLFIVSNLATMVDDYGIEHDWAIGINDNVITWLGPKDDLPSHSAAKEIELSSEYWLTPGLIDCHTHLVYAGNRADEFNLRLSGLSYAEIAQQGGGILSTVKSTRLASETELYQESIKRLQQMQQQGVTTVEIKSGYGLDKASELKMLRVARKLAADLNINVKTTLLAAHTVPPEFDNRADDYIDLVCNDILPTAMQEGLVDAVDAFCEGIAFSPEQVARVFACAQQFNLPVKLHAEQLSHLGGASIAAQYNATSADHLEYAEEADVMAMANAGTTAVLLPGAFYFLNETKLPPIELLRQQQVPMAIATDCNPGSSPTTSLPLMASMAARFFKLSPLEAWQGMTINAAKALGLAASHGCIALGKQADFSAWEFDHPQDLVYQFGVAPLYAITY